MIDSAGYGFKFETQVRKWEINLKWQQRGTGFTSSASLSPFRVATKVDEIVPSLLQLKNHNYKMCHSIFYTKHHSKLGVKVVLVRWAHFGPLWLFLAPLRSLWLLWVMSHQNILMGTALSWLPTLIIHEKPFSYRRPELEDLFSSWGWFALKEKLLVPNF